MFDAMDYIMGGFMIALTLFVLAVGGSIVYGVAMDSAVQKPAICAGLNAHDCIAKLQGEPI